MVILDALMVSPNSFAITRINPKGNMVRNGNAIQVPLWIENMSGNIVYKRKKVFKKINKIFLL